MKRLIAAALLATGATVFGADQSAAPAVLGHLEAREHVLTIWAGAQPRYSVRTRDGKLLADKITAAELRARYPVLSRINDATTVAWAGL